MQSWPVFLLIFCRITSFFVAAPVFSSRNVPNVFKIGMAFFVSLVVFSSQGTSVKVAGDLTIVLLILQEVLVGLLLGYLAYLMLMAIQIAGSFLDLQIGFSIANVIDPMTGSSAPLLGNFKYMIALLLFLSMNGHHYLLDAIISSYRWVPLQADLYTPITNGSLSGFVIQSVGQAFMLAFQMSAPIVTALFLTDIGLAFLARTAPQYNVFVIGVPLKIIIGLLLLVILMPTLAALFQSLFGILFESMRNLLSVLGNQSPAP